MIYGSVCSGVEAASVAWHELGWKPAWFCEFDKFPSAVLDYRYPNVPNLGDMTIIEEREEYREQSIELLVGGTPCQSFSIAGLRKGLGDERGNLALKFCEILQQKNPRWFVWENVAGVLSSNGGRDFGNILGAMGECGYGFAYRVLDAQYFGVPQRRRRVFVVGYFGDWRPASAVLFEQESLRGYIAPSKGKRKEIAQQSHQCLASGKEQCGTLMANAETKLWLSNQEAFSGDYFVISTAHTGSNGSGISDKETAYTLEATPSCNQAIAGTLTTAYGSRGVDMEQIANGNHSIDRNGVRRFTPIECERLQGFPDNWTQIPWRAKPANDCPDGPRYKCMGNSMAVPVMRWLGNRIKLVDGVINAKS